MEKRMNGAVGMRDTRKACGAAPRAGGGKDGRPAPRRGPGRSRFASALAGVVLAGGFAGLTALNTGCAQGPHVLSRAEQHVIDRQFVEYPAGFEFRRYIAGLDAPTA